MHIKLNMVLIFSHFFLLFNSTSYKLFHQYPCSSYFCFCSNVYFSDTNSSGFVQVALYSFGYLVKFAKDSL